MTTPTRKVHAKPAGNSYGFIPPTITTPALFGLIWQSRVVDSEQEDTLFRVTSASPNPDAAANDVLQKGLLSEFQLSEIIAGRGNHLVLGPYILLDQIGQGGMGRVFRARHRQLREDRAVKIIRKDLPDCEATTQRFLREGRAGARLCHENIVRTLDLGCEGDTLFLVTDYVAGRDLNQLVAAHGPLDCQQAAGYARQAALGLQHAFEHGVIHRDIKPSNLMVSSDQVVKLLDLGLARIFRDDGRSSPSLLTPDGTVLGTPDFAAPEQLAGGQADTRSDIYSLGCTLYFLLTGQPPFPGGDLWSKFVRHHSVLPPVLTDLRRDVPAGFAAIVSRMVEKDPARRYQTPIEAANALQSCFSGE